MNKVTLQSTAAISVFVTRIFTSLVLRIYSDYTKVHCIIW